ncbi:TrmH family RNA methyltransferase [Neptunitalea lumnitzerae]|uniref:rRNA methyltransferase n=1 Tax=Neptunitalea lumnitzerae TaxID=2965509 RepID=A0ABQ5MLE9_9FLAO|nr:RNA methyltransferase [Neptunitalea sp. Y10]GLB49895.1 rRNA methyltransferase [Neptunitalea sp. Y10]
MKIISSIQNPFIKNILQLKEKSRLRKKTQTFVIEGQREISLAIKGGYNIESILYYPEICSTSVLNEIIPTTLTPEVIEISKEVYQKIAYRETTEGIVAIAKSKALTLESLSFKREAPLILVAEAPEKPGNIGALLRTADAANLDAVIIANPKTDMYNPNILRSSVGCIFTNNIATGTTEEIITYLKAKSVTINCAALSASIPYQTQDFTQPTAIVVGTEATGLSDTWLSNASQNIIIPMQGEIDSMNVSVAAAILIFEAKRQRNFD